MTDQLPSKECDEAFVKLVAILQTSAYSAGASGGNAGLDTMSSSRAAIIDCYGQLERKLDTCGLQCSSTMKSLLAENERFRTALTGISTCSTCEACRGAALRALGEDAAKINAAVDERLDRVERELAVHPDHPKNDWQCNVCKWMNFGSRTSCGHCEMSRPAQPPGDGRAAETTGVIDGVTKVTLEGAKVWRDGMADAIYDTGDGAK